MENDKFMTLAQDTFARCLSLLDKKGHDYSSNIDRMRNFRNVSKCWTILSTKDMSMFDSALYMVLLKIDRICNLVASAKTPANESVQDSFDDLINYCVLMRATLEVPAIVQTYTQKDLFSTSYPKCTECNIELDHQIIEHDEGNGLTRTEYRLICRKCNKDYGDVGKDKGFCASC